LLADPKPACSRHVGPLSFSSLQAFF
jgi:hypothetical protein